MAASEIDAYIASRPGWQRDNLTRFRDAVHRVALSAEEAMKWNVPVFLLGGRLVCGMASFATHTKYNFFDGATLADPHHLFNAGLEAKKSRSIDLATGDVLDTSHLDHLLGEAFAANRR